jgi:hypothetical protein
MRDALAQMMIYPLENPYESQKVEVFARLDPTAAVRDDTFCVWIDSRT